MAWRGMGFIEVLRLAAARSVWSARSLLPPSERAAPANSASKLDALQTLRAVRLRFCRAALMVRRGGSARRVLGGGPPPLGLPPRAPSGGGDFQRPPRPPH